MSDDRSRTNGPSRRRFLNLAGTAGLLGVAGCAGGGDVAPPAEAWAEGGPPNRDGWDVTFADRFEDGELDDERWNYGMGGGTERCPSHDAPNHCWAEDHAWVDEADERLVLKASDEEPAGDARYTFGAVTTDPYFRQEFGYFEAKCRMSATNGTLPAFWMLSDFDEHRYRELTFEARGIDGGEAIHHGFYVQDDAGEILSPGEDFDGPRNVTDDIDPPLDEAFHVLGIEWAPDYVAYHVDGEESVRWTKDVIAEWFPGAPMYLILNHGVMEGGSWVGWPTPSAFPSFHEVEWVRAWQHQDWE